MGVPAVLWPHFADQFVNASNLLKQGAGIELCNIQRTSKDYDDYLSYRNPCFDSNHVKSTFEKVLNDPKYKQNMLKLQAQSWATGGRDLAVKTIEREYIAGCDHLIDQDLIRKTNSLSCCLSCWTILIFTSLFGFLLYGTIMYYTSDNAV